MSTHDSHAPEGQACGAPELALRIAARPKDLGGFSVRRVLPTPRCRSVGPFVFVDHIGPADMAPGSGIDVRPHPHIGLATVTYLFAGEIEHRDSLGSHQLIEPGAINWMTAGRGIVHSERTREALRERGYHLHGMQIWVALPKEAEETEPSFTHYPADVLPRFEHAGATLRLLVGSAYGQRAPVRTFAEMFYVDAALPESTRLPLPAEHDECAVYVIQGKVDVCGERFGEGEMAVLKPHAADASVHAPDGPASVMLLGGASLDGPRHMYWNFVHSQKERIEEAKALWRSEGFPLVPGDEKERIPLPD